MSKKQISLIFLFCIAIIALVFLIGITKIKNRIAIVEKTELEKNGEIIIFGLGDMMFDRGVESWLIKQNKNPFEKINFNGENSPLKADLVVGNLEGPITDNLNCQKKLYSFRFATNTPEILKNAGITHVTLANNHSYDYFLEGLEDTRKFLREKNVGFLGGYEINDSFSTTTVKGKKIALVGIDFTIMPIKLDEIYFLVRNLKPDNDYVVVFVHWGNEYEKIPNNEQMEIAHKLVDLGTDAIIGGHPHIIQTAEIYNNKPIIYSLGNFIFDQTDEGGTKGEMAKMIISTKDNSIKYELIPYTIIKGMPAVDL